MGDTKGFPVRSRQGQHRVIHLEEFGHLAEEIADLRLDGVDRALDQGRRESIQESVESGACGHGRIPARQGPSLWVTTAAWRPLAVPCDGAPSPVVAAPCGPGQAETIMPFADKCFQ